MEIHLDAFDESVERAARKMEARDNRLERAPLGRLRLTVVVAPPQPPAQTRALSLLFTRSRSIRRIINRPAEVPHGDDRVALFRREDEKRVVETGVSRHIYNLSAARRSRGEGRQNTARHRSDGTSAFVNVGRRRKMSKSVVSSLSRIRVPPSQVARNSYRSLPLTASQAARPSPNSARVRRVTSSRAARHSGVSRRAARSASRAPAAIQIDS